MEILLQTTGLTSGELTQMAVVGAILLGGLFLARVMLKLTAALFKTGCFAIIFILAAILVLNLLN